MTQSSPQPNTGKQHYAIIVLGLGKVPRLYIPLVHHWQKRYGVIPIIHVAGWHNKSDPFEAKLSRLTRQVQQLTSQGHRVTLIGTSAGASLALNAQAALRQHYTIPVYCICGRFNLTKHWWYPLRWGVHRVPAYEQSIQKVMRYISSLQPEDYQNIRCARAWFDEVVPASASQLPLASGRVIPMVLHSPAIYTQLVFASAIFANNATPTSPTVQSSHPAS